MSDKATNRNILIAAMLAELLEGHMTKCALSSDDLNDIPDIIDSENAEQYTITSLVNLPEIDGTSDGILILSLDDGSNIRITVSEDQIVS